MTPKYSAGALVGAIMLAASLWSCPANALTFHWSIAGGNIEGFISDLNDNQSGQAATSVTVTASIIGGVGEYVGPGVVVNNFDVLGEAITFASFQSDLGSFHLILALNPTINSGILFDNAVQHGLGGAISFEATPLPAALPLFASGASVLGFLGWRRKRKAQAAALAA